MRVGVMAGPVVDAPRRRAPGEGAAWLGTAAPPAARARRDLVGSSGAADGSNDAFVWDKLRGAQDLGVLPGGTFSNALGINDAGQVVGISDVPSGRGTVGTPFYWDKRTGMIPLASLVAADDPLKDLVEFDAAQAINNRGVIVANGLILKPGYANTRYRAFLLIPTN